MDDTQPTQMHVEQPTRMGDTQPTQMHVEQPTRVDDTKPTQMDGEETTQIKADKNMIENGEGALASPANKLGELRMEISDLRAPPRTLGQSLPGNES